MKNKEDKEKNNNEQENPDNNDEKQKQNKGEYISILNADFTDKRTFMDSPRSIQACLNLGIQASELIQLDLEEFKEKYPEVRSLSPEMLKYRYNAAEKFRIQSINLIKKERQRIMEEDEVSPDGLRRTLTNMSRTAGSGGWNKVTDTSSLPDDKMEQILMEQKKAIQKIKQKQRQDIQAMIKEQIDKEISEKVNIEKQRRQREKKKKI